MPINYNEQLHAAPEFSILAKENHFAFLQTAVASVNNAANSRGLNRHQIITEAKRYVDRKNQEKLNSREVTSRILKELENFGVIRDSSVLAKKNGANKIYSITEKGRRLYSYINDFHMQREIAKLTSDTAKSILENIQKINEMLVDGGDSDKLYGIFSDLYQKLPGVSESFFQEISKFKNLVADASDAEIQVLEDVRTMLLKDHATTRKYFDDARTEWRKLAKPVNDPKRLEFFIDTLVESESHTAQRIIAAASDSLNHQTDSQSPYIAIEKMVDNITFYLDNTTQNDPIPRMISSMDGIWDTISDRLHQKSLQQLTPERLGNLMSEFVDNFNHDQEYEMPISRMTAFKNDRFDKNEAPIYFEESNADFETIQVLPYIAKTTKKEQVSADVYLEPEDTADPDSQIKAEQVKNFLQNKQVLHLTSDFDAETVFVRDWLIEIIVQVISEPDATNPIIKDMVSERELEISNIQDVDVPIHTLQDTIEENKGHIVSHLGFDITIGKDLYA